MTRRICWSRCLSHSKQLELPCKKRWKRQRSGPKIDWISYTSLLHHVNVSCQFLYLYPFILSIHGVAANWKLGSESPDRTLCQMCPAIRFWRQANGWSLLCRPWTNTTGASQGSSASLRDSLTSIGLEFADQLLIVMVFWCWYHLPTSTIFYLFCGRMWSHFTGWECPSWPMSSCTETKSWPGNLRFNSPCSLQTSPRPSLQRRRTRLWCFTVTKWAMSRDGSGLARQVKRDWDTTRFS